MGKTTTKGKKAQDAKTKQEPLADLVYESLKAGHESVTREIAKDAAEIAIHAIREETRRCGRYLVPGLGVFRVKERPARSGRNPRTGETIEIPAKTVVTFRANSEFARNVAS